MAQISTSFVANFENFFSQVDKAEVELRDFAVDAEKVQLAVDKIGRSFSGEQLIQKADMTARAIEGIGGASNLTEREARRVHAAMSEAMEKMRAMGMEIPPRISALAGETQNAANKFEALKNPLNDIKEKMLAAFSVEAVRRAFTAFTDFTGKLTDLANKTGISTTALQSLNLITMQAGLSIDKVSDGVVKMARNLVGGDDKAVAAINALGLKTRDLLAMSPDRAFATIGEAIAKIKNPGEQAAAAVAIFGRAGAEYLPAFTTDMRELLAEAERSKFIIGDDMVAAGDDAADALDRLKLAGMRLLADVFGPLAPAVEYVADLVGGVLPSVFSTARGWFDSLILKGMELVLKIREMALSIMELTREVPVLGEKFGYSDERIRGMRESVQNAKDTISAFTRDAVKPAQGDLEQAAARSNELSGAFERNKTKANDNERAVSALVSQLTGEGLNKQVKTLEEAYQRLTPEQRANEDITRKVAEQAGKLREKGAELTPVLQAVYEHTGTLRSKTIDWSSALVDLKPALEDSSAEILKAREESALAATFFGESARTAKEFAAAGGVLAPALQSMNVSLEVSKTTTVDWKGQLDSLVRSFEQMATIGGASLQNIVRWLGNVLAAAKLADEGGKALKTSFDGLRDGSQNAGAALIGMATGAMSVYSALQQATGQGNTFERTLGGLNTGFAVGNAILPGFGGAVGAVAGGLIGLFRGLSSVSEETRKVRGEIASFEEGLRKNLTSTQQAEAAGRGWAATTIAVRDAYILTGRSAAEAEVIVKQLWDDKNPAAARAAIEQINLVMAEAKRIAEELDRELNGALREAVELGMQLPEELAGSIEQLIEMGRITGDNAALFGQLTAQTEPNFKKMEEAAKKYGVELSALGPAFAQNQINQQAKDIIDSFETMKRGGADVGGVIVGMSDEINKFVQDTLRAGGTVPENMRPIIQAMIEQGRLTDENGTKLEDMSGINFGPPVESAFDKIITKLQELIDKLTGGMGFNQAQAQAQAFATNATNAINNIPRRVDVEFVASGDDTNQDGDPGFASGTLCRTGSWFKNFGAGTLTVLHGEEAVVRKDQAGAFAAAFGGGSDGVVDELRSMRADMMAMPQHMARAVRDALLVAG